MKLGAVFQSKLFLSLLFIFIFLILLAEGVYYWLSVKKSPPPEVTSQPYLGEMIATGRVEVFLSPGDRKVGYFVSGQKFTPTGEQEGDWIRVVDSDGYELWIQKDSFYEPAKEVR